MEELKRIETYTIASIVHVHCRGCGVGKAHDGWCARPTSKEVASSAATLGSRVAGRTITCALDLSLNAQAATTTTPASGLRLSDRRPFIEARTPIQIAHTRHSVYASLYLLMTQRALIGCRVALASKKLFLMTR
jgi:hypothetical protein